MKEKTYIPMCAFERSEKGMEFNMRKLNLVVVFNKDLNKALFCIRAKEPYKGMYNFVGGKVEEGETNDELLNIQKFAGNYNIPHIITQIKVYLKNEVEIFKSNYQQKT